MISIKTSRDTDKSIKWIQIQVDVFMNNFRIICLHMNAPGIYYEIFKKYHSYAEQKIFLSYDEYILLTSKIMDEIKVKPYVKFSHPSKQITRLEKSENVDNNGNNFWKFETYCAI